MGTDQQFAKDIHESNLAYYKDYYAKPLWWFRLRYDTQVKRKTCLSLLKKAKKGLSNQRVLEIGFGSGLTLFSFDPSSEIYGLEISASAIAEARRNASHMGYRHHDFQQADGSRIPYESRKFDIVIASHVLEHVEDDAGLLQEIHRVVKPDGVAVILVPINENYNDPNHVRHYTSASFTQLAARCHFDILLHLENEYLFHLVEKFYLEGYHERWRIFGWMIAAVFNIPTAILPFSAYQVIDALMRTIGFRPRQSGFVMIKAES